MAYNFFLLGVIAVIGLILVFKVWNYFSRKYNNGILVNSNCRNCDVVLGETALNKALVEWQQKLAIIKKEVNMGTAILRDLEIICPNCGTIHSEKELYQRKKKNKLHL